MSDTDEVEYVFVKGQGWVPREKPTELPPTIWDDIKWVATDRPVNRYDLAATTTATPVRYFYTIQDDLTWAGQNVWYVNQAPVAPAPVSSPARPRDEIATRYYAGSNVRPEAVTPENQHARRVREWREAGRRWRRTR